MHTYLIRLEFSSENTKTKHLVFTELSDKELYTYRIGPIKMKAIFINTFW